MSFEGLEAFFGLIGTRRWQARLAEIRDLCANGPRAGQANRQRFAIELTLARLRRQPGTMKSPADRLLARIAADTADVASLLSRAGRARLRAWLDDSLSGANTLVPVFHMVRTAMLQSSRGFEVRFTGLEAGTPYDLLLRRDHTEAEVACDVFNAEEGRGVHRAAWFRLADLVDPDLQTWLAAHPGRYLLKMTLPLGLRGNPQNPALDNEILALLHQRIRALLAAKTRQDCDQAIVLRLDPLLLAGAQAEDMGLISRLRREFGPEAHLSVTTAGNGIFVMAARAGRENEIAIAIRRCLAALAPARLSGEHPGILALFVEDTDRAEWRGLRERLELEGEARQFMTNPAARPVVAVTFASRLELFGLGEPDAAAGGELRFRNPGHPAARLPALAPAVMSSV